MRVVPVLLLVAALGLATAAAGSPAGAEEDASESSGLLDQIHLRNGNIFEGHIVREDADALVVDLASDTGGKGRLRFPRSMISRVIRGVEGGTVASRSPVRDAWYLLKSDGSTVGIRRLRLRHRRGEGGTGWQLEEDIVQFARGPHVPASRIHRLETTDLAFFPQLMHHREVDAASSDPDGPRRYERVFTGPVKNGIWHALEREGAEGVKRQIALPAGIRGRLGTREDLLRRREDVGIREVSFFDVTVGAPKTIRAGYTALDLEDESGSSYDEFVWEEDGVRLVSRFRSAEVVREWVTEGVVAVPVTRAQAEAAAAAAESRVREDEARQVRLPELGLSMELPGDTWTQRRIEVPPGTRGWRHVAQLESRYFVADARIEWDPEHARHAPTPEEAQESLLQRLRAACPDLQVLGPRRPLGPNVPGGWRLDLRGTLKGERIRTVAVVVARGEGRALLLIACPESTWDQASSSVERLLGSIEVL